MKHAVRLGLFDMGHELVEGLTPALMEAHSGMLLSLHFRAVDGNGGVLGTRTLRFEQYGGCKGQVVRFGGFWAIAG